WALIETAGDAVAEADQNALLQSLFSDLRGVGSETFFTRDANELFQQWSDLPGRDTMNADSAQRVHSKLIVHRILPGAHQDPEIRGTPAAEKIFTRRRNVFARIA